MGRTPGRTRGRSARRGQTSWRSWSTRSVRCRSPPMRRRWKIRATHSVGEEALMAEKNFDAFKQTIEERFMHHPVVTGNAYTQWFAHGEMPVEHLRRFAIEFSVFS